MITPSYSATATERVLPRMALDFTTGVLDSRVTVTRALNTATRVNSSGYVEIVNANLPRFDYDPVTLLPKGLLIEEARTNFCLSSGNVANTSNWTGDTLGGSVPIATANYALSPDGTITATRLQIDRGAGVFSRWSQGISPPSAVYTDSIWMRTTSGSGTANVGLRNASAGVNCVVTGQWQRFQISSGTATTGPDIQILSFTSIPGTDVSADILVWGAQVEAGAFATSYIPTTTTSLTRNADAVSMTGTNFSSWYNQTQGALGADFTLSPGLPSTNPRIFVMSDVNGNGRIIDLTAVTNWVSYDGTVVFSSGVAAVTSSSVAKAMAAYAAGSYALAINGNTPGISSSALLNTATQLYIGSYPTGSNYLNGHIRNVRYWPQRLTNAEVQAFSKV